MALERIAREWSSWRWENSGRAMSAIKVSEVHLSIVSWSKNSFVSDNLFYKTKY